MTRSGAGPVTAPTYFELGLLARCGHVDWVLRNERRGRAIGTKVDLAERALEYRPEPGFGVVEIVERPALVDHRKEASAEPRMCRRLPEDRVPEEDAIRRQHSGDVLDGNGLALHGAGQAVDDTTERRRRERPRRRQRLEN